MKKMTRILSVFLAVALLCTLLPQLSLFASAASDFGYCGMDGDNLTWSFDTTTRLLTITGRLTAVITSR